jgi:hypothetical protein
MKFQPTLQLMIWISPILGAMRSIALWQVSKWLGFFFQYG